MKTPSLNTLRRIAARCTAWRGHAMRWTPVTDDRIIGICRHCTMYVQCDTTPQSNGIDIGGTAVALSCPRK
jgi:hypothetical protein